MKRTKKQVLGMITVSYLLLNSLVLSGAVFAETVPSEEVKTTSTSSPISESLSSSLPNIPAPAISSSEPTVSSEAKEAAKILSYEDNQLLEVAKADSVIPAIVFQKKELENGLTIQGTISAGSEENQSETVLSALILQRQVESGEWEEVHPFSIDEDGIDLAENEFAFEYSEGVEKTGEVRYRLAADYAIKYSDDEQTQKGSLEIGTITKTEKKESQEQTEESTPATQESSEAVQESTTESTQESSGLTEQSTVESSGQKVESKQEESIDPSADFGIVSPKTLGENNQIPKMQDTYREAFQRGLGIMPLFSRILTTANYSEIEAWKGDSPTGSAIADFPTVYKATYTSKTTVDVEFQLKWSYLGYSRGGWAGEIYGPEVDKRKYKFDFTFNVEDEAPNYWYLGSNNDRYSAVGNLELRHLTKQQIPGNQGVREIESLGNDRKIEHVPVNGNTEVWSHNTTVIKFKNIPTGTTDPNKDREIYVEYMLGTGNNASRAKKFYFKPSTAVDLTDVSKPTFTATDGVTNSVKMNSGTYTGDISDDTSDGIFKISSDEGTNWSVYSSSLTHTKTKNGTYSGLSINNLTAGSKYRGQVFLNDWLNTSIRSPNEAFYTPNSVNKPSVKTNTAPTTSNNASVSLEGTYDVGVTPAHPLTEAGNVETQISTNGINFTNWTSSSSTFVDQLNKKVGFTLNGLKSKTTYYVQYRVKNNSKAWSPWSASTEFTTRAVPLVVEPPTFDHSSAATNKITMNSGTYTGDASTTPGDNDKGAIRYTDGSTWRVFPSSLHSTPGVGGGTYSSIDIDNLTPGTAHLAQVGIIDDAGTLRYSATSKQVFYTLNTVTKPIIDTIHPSTGKYNASATISGVYGIGPAGTSPAHPDRVEVQISLDGGSTWDDVNGSSTPKLDSQSIDKLSTTASFTIIKMKANTKYHVRYRVKNGYPNEESCGWSAWSSSSDEFKTLSAPPSMELINAPKFDFGMLKNENFQQTATLDSASTKNHVELENTILASGWKLTAKLDHLKRTDNPSIVMPGATLSMDINLQNSVDDGGTWANYNQGVSGSPGIVTIDSGVAAKTLWSISNPVDAQGYFRTEIKWNSVTLDVPANQTGMYAGNLVWSLDDTP